MFGREATSQLERVDVAVNGGHRRPERLDLAQDLLGREVTGVDDQISRAHDLDARRRQAAAAAREVCVRDEGYEHGRRLEYLDMEDPMIVTRSVAVPLAEIELRASRSSGPGGQHANVTASRIEAVFDVTASKALTDVQKRRVTARVGDRLTAVAQDERSQARNRELALERIRERLAVALAVPRPRRPTGPTAAARRRRLEAKRRAAERKRTRRRPSADDD